MRLRNVCLGVGALLGALAVPLILGRVPPNGSYGFRTPLTMSSPDVWYPANVFAGWALLAAALATVIALLAAPRRLADHDGYQIAALLVPVAVAAGASFLYLERFG